MGKENHPRKSVGCIVNPYAANRKWKRRLLIRRYLQRHLPGDIYECGAEMGSAVELARHLSQSKDVIIAAGGDGTISDVIQGIVEGGRHHQITLGIIPLGSGNAFITSLGIPKNIVRAVKIIQEYHTQTIDLLDIDGRIGTFASVGATAQITCEKLQGRFPGLFGHLLAARIMLKLSKKDQQIELSDGLDDAQCSFAHKVLNLKVFDCVIGKTRHFGYKWKVAPMAKINDGYIDITFFEISGLKYLIFFPSIYFGLFQKTQRHFKAKKIIIRGQNLPVQCNGEVLGIKDELSIEILPRVLRIIRAPEKNTS